MINYLQLSRNLRRFAPRVEAKKATYIYNSKGIYDFKKKSPELNEALTDTYRGVNNPVLEITVKKTKNPIGIISIKDGETELSQDMFALKEGEKVEDFLPATDGCIKKLIFDKKGIAEIAKQYDLLKKLLIEITSGLQNPSLEFWYKSKSKYSIGNIVLRDGEKVITKGYFSKTNNKAVPVEKFHFINDQELISGYNIRKDTYSKKSARLPQKILKRLWMLDERAKSMVKERYGVDCSPKTPEQIAKHWNLTGSRVRGILNDSRSEMETANTYNIELKSDLDNLGYILSDSERYNIYRTGSSVDINKAEYKIIKHKMEMKKLSKEKS